MIVAKTDGGPSANVGTGRNSNTASSNAQTEFVCFNGRIGYDWTPIIAQRLFAYLNNPHTFLQPQPQATDKRRVASGSSPARQIHVLNNNPLKEKLIDVVDLSVKRGSNTLIHNVSLSVSRGEIVTLVGPNGSGKSTTIKAILGIQKPDSGSVSSLDRLSIGYVPQKLEINWTMPLTVNRFMRLTQKYNDSTITDALATTGVDGLQNREMAALSGGEFQRVLMARAIASKPDLLVLDEPVQGVDFNAELEIYQLIAQLRDELNCGVLLVSHDLHIVMAETDTVICLNGHVCCSGSPQVVTNSPEFMDLFGARGSEALAIYRHHHDHTHGPDGEVIHDHTH